MLARGQGVGPLHGVPVGIKDIIETRDMPTQNGFAGHEGRHTHRDAFCVGQLRDAGAVILGKTVTTELAVRTPGKTRNPRRGTHSPGGSSSGSAAAVADGQVPFALGTKTGGSVIRPDSFCGVHGFKPGFGLIGRSGVTQMAPWLDTIGTFGRSVEDVTFLAEQMLARDATDPQALPRSRPPLSRTRDAGAALASPAGVRAHAGLGQGRRLGAAGARGVRRLAGLELPGWMAEAWDWHRTLQTYGIRAALRPARRTRPSPAAAE